MAVAAGGAVSFPKRLKLIALGKPELEGVGEGLTLIFSAYRPAKYARGAETFRGEVRLEVGRYYVRWLAEQIAAMQVRDRERINDELARLSREVAPLLKNPNGQE